MLYVTHSPGPPLSEFVECFWLLAGAQTPRKERILPSGTIELVVNLHEDEMRIHDPARPRYKRFSGAILSGTYSKVFICDAMQHESIVGVHFKPGGAFPFLGVLANELADAHTDLADLWGRSAPELRERLCEVTTPRARFRIMEQFLRERLHRRAAKRHPALPSALNMFGLAGTAATVRDDAEFSGLTPTEYLRHNQQDGRLKDNHVPLPGRSIFSNTEGDSRWTMDRSTAIDAPMDSAGGA